jgi:ribosomal protein S18 acetylase RimI-like enzyme
MTVVDDVLGARDIALLARMHVESLPESMVSRVGERYARAFYRYLARSPEELVLLDREETTGDLRGACIVSLAPDTLSRRLLYRTPLPLHAALAVRRLPLGAMLAGAGAKVTGGRTRSPEPLCPEILLIFTVPAARSQGLGARLLERCEALLAARGVDQLRVRTRDDPANRALGFYERASFTRVASLSTHGKQLVLFRKAISPRSSHGREQPRR